ncbi:CENP-B protein [Alternaria alternata]|nr:CENP-B protein [Alternaria alternata]
MDARELALQSAIADLTSGVYTSQRKAAQAWGVPRSTLQERLNRRQPNAIAHSNQQRLTPEQERLLADWILQEDSRAQPPSRSRVREIATQILRMNGDNKPLGQLWVPHFITRNPRIASIFGRSAESTRTTVALDETVRALRELLERTRIKLEDREWVSIIETISATGTKLYRLVIFKGKHLQSTWFPDQDTLEWLYTTSENG